MHTATCKLPSKNTTEYKSPAKDYIEMRVILARPDVKDKATGPGMCTPCEFCVPVAE